MEDILKKLTLEQVSTIKNSKSEYCELVEKGEKVAITFYNSDVLDLLKNVDNVYHMSYIQGGINFFIENLGYN